MMQQGEQTLSQKLERGEALAAELDLHLSAGNQLLARLVRIAGVTGPAGESPAVQDARPWRLLRRHLLIGPARD